MKRIVIIGAVIAGLWLAFGRDKPPKIVSAPPPAMVTSAEGGVPAQEAMSAPYSFEINGYTVTTLAQFALHARALSAKGYSSGNEADVSPLDVAFGWGRMADPAVFDRLAITQGSRWYHWRYEGAPPIPPREIEVSSANMHLIPADAAVARTLGAIRKGQMVSLRGYLVEVKSKNGWRWRSSLTREDTGQGACEVIFVQSVSVI